MFNKKFWKDAGEAFAVSAATVVVGDIASVINADSKAALAVAGIALARAALIAGFAALAKRLPVAASDASDAPAA